MEGLDLWMSCVYGDIECDTSKQDMEKYFSLIIDDLSKSILCATRSSMNLLVKMVNFRNHKDEEPLKGLFVAWDSFIN